MNMSKVYQRKKVRLLTQCDTVNKIIGNFPDSLLNGSLEVTFSHRIVNKIYLDAEYFNVSCNKQLTIEK